MWRLKEDKNYVTKVCLDLILFYLYLPYLMKRTFLFCGCRAVISYTGVSPPVFRKKRSYQDVLHLQLFQCLQLKIIFVQLSYCGLLPAPDCRALLVFLSIQGPFMTPVRPVLHTAVTCALVVLLIISVSFAWLLLESETYESRDTVSPVESLLGQSLVCHWGQ